jgi:N-acetylneuraminate synthase
MANCIAVGSQDVGPGMPCFIIAEAGVNHNGDPETACRLVDAAVSAGADAVKFQTFRADRMTSWAASKADYQKKTTDVDETQLEMLHRLELSPQAHRELQAYCAKRGIVFISTPFDEESVDLLDSMDVPLFKVGSGEITNWPLLRYIARKGRPIILSTGMSYLAEVDEAVREIEGAGCSDLVLLHCVSNYPADPSNVNLRAMKAMATSWNLPIGYSDHTPGIEVAIAAVAMGACVIEKHFTLDRTLPGPDHRASLEPDELERMVTAIRMIEVALGDGRKRPALSEAETAQVARKSLVAACDIPAGRPLAEGNVAIKRPGTGLPPSMLRYVLGRTAREDIPAGTLITLEMVQ